MLRSIRSLSGTGRPGVPLELPIRTLPQWGVPDARSALERHEMGQFRASALLAEAMTQDPRVSAVLSTRVKVLTGLPRQFVPADDSDQAHELARLAEAEWLRWVPEPDAEALHRWLLLMGLGLGQLIWDRSSIPWRPRLNVWHPSNLYWYWDTDRQLGKYQLITAVEDGVVEPIPGDGQWIFAKSGAKRPWMSGLVRTLAVPWIVRLYARQDWARYSEVHGLPIRKAVIPAQATQEDIELFESQLRNIGGEATVTVKQGADGNRFDFQLVEATSNTHAAFGDLMATQDADIAIAVLGQNLTTEVDGGSRAAISVHELVRHDLLEADASLMGSVWTEQVLRPWAALNYGRADLAPTLRYVTDPPEDAQKKAETLAAIAQALAAFEAAKIPVDRERILREMGVPMMGRPTGGLVQLDAEFEDQHPREENGEFRAKGNASFGRLVRRVHIRKSDGRKPGDDQQKTHSLLTRVVRPGRALSKPLASEIETMPASDLDREITRLQERLGDAGQSSADHEIDKRNLHELQAEWNHRVRRTQALAQAKCVALRKQLQDAFDRHSHGEERTTVHRVEVDAFDPVSGHIPVHATIAIQTPSEDLHHSPSVRHEDVAVGFLDVDGVFHEGPDRPREEARRDALEQEIRRTLPKNVLISVDRDQPIEDQNRFLEEQLALRDSRIGASLYNYMRAHPNHIVDIRMVDDFKDAEYSDMLNRSNRKHNGARSGDFVGKTNGLNSFTLGPTRTIIEISTPQLSESNNHNGLTGVDRHSVAEITAHELGHAIDGIERKEVGAEGYPKTISVFNAEGERVPYSLSNASACYAGLAYRREVGAGESEKMQVLNHEECLDLNSATMPVIPYAPVTRSNQDVKDARTTIPRDL